MNQTSLVHKVLCYGQGDQRIRLWHQGRRHSDSLYGPYTHYPMGSGAFSVEVNQLRCDTNHFPSTNMRI